MRCSASHTSTRMYAHGFALAKRPPAPKRRARSNDRTVETHLFDVLQPAQRQHNLCRIELFSKTEFLLLTEKMSGSISNFIIDLFTPQVLTGSPRYQDVPTTALLSPKVTTKISHKFGRLFNGALTDHIPKYCFYANTRRWEERVPICELHERRYINTLRTRIISHSCIATLTSEINGILPIAAPRVFH